VRPGFVSFVAWRLDVQTWGWIVWMLFFLAWETYTLRWHPGQELTAHARAVFLSFPVVWWVAFGLWLWFGVHMLAPAWERGLLDAIGRG